MANPAEDLQKDPLLQTAPSCEGFKVLEPAVLYARIGAGGMGAVYRGRHFSLECDVAVKVLKPDLAHDEQFVARFAREAKLAARISNDNVVRVLDVKEKNGIHYLVMEFVKGETARERVKRKGRLAEAEALAVVFGAAMGLREAHAQGIVHRDIKPDNVLVSAEGAIKLADLGLAKQKQAPGEQNLTVLASGVMGTPQYMPPEQWRTPDVTAAADVWALGATLYYLLAGHSGIPAGEMLVIAEHVRDHDFPSILAVRPDVRPEVAALIAKCTQRKPEQRFADARELVKALRPLVAIDDELLKDPEAGAGSSNVALVTPPPRATLARIKLQVEQDPDDVATRPGGMPGGATRPAADAEARPWPDEKATVAGARVAATTTTGAAMEPVVGKHRAAAWIVLAVLLVAASGGYAAGWFGPRPSPQQPLATGGKPHAAPAQQGNEPSAGNSATDAPTNPTTEPQDAVTPGQPADPAREAKAALARGLEALPRAAGLDTAIEQFELALRLDSSLAEAKQSLVLAQVRKSKQLATTDPDAAYEAARRAVDVAPDDNSAKEVLATATAALQKRLAASVSVRVPGAGAVLGAATVRVEGAVTAPNVRSVRVALVAGDGAGTSPFPRAQATAAPVVGGAFEASVRAAGDGPHQVRVEVEHTRGPTAEMAPLGVVIDTLAPKVTIVKPAEDAFVGALVEVVVQVVDASATTVVVAGQAATRSAEGAFVARVPLADGAQQLVVVATDAAGHEGRATRRLRVDAQPPVVTIAPALPAWTKEPQLRIRGTVADAGGTATLTIAGAAVAVNADGSFEAVVPIAEARENEIPIVARDAAGNESAPAVARVRYDNTPPVLAWSPQDPAPMAGDVALSGTVADASPCEVQVNGTAATVMGERWTATVRLDADTDFVVKITARDAAGNEAEPLQRTLRAERPFTKLAWAVPARDAQHVAIGNEVYPSVAVDIGTGIRMVLVPAAPQGFTMGSPAGEAERGDDETAHQCVIRKPFWLGETEVTQAQWQAAMGNNPSHQQGEGLPVDSVSWDDCQAFVQKLNVGGAGAGFRLPSEAEWEYACRAGSDSPFAFGAAITSEQVNFDGSRPYPGSSKSQNRRQALPAHSLPANAFGLFDMHGNVHEWCEDTYAPYPGTGTEEPTRGDGKRVVRGGAWGSMASGCRSAFRFSSYDRWTKNERVGLRLARSLEPQ